MTDYTWEISAIDRNGVCVYANTSDPNNGKLRMWYTDADFARQAMNRRAKTLKSSGYTDIKCVLYRRIMDDKIVVDIID